ncbi:DUF6443 domain-containing protein [Flavobacterium sp.]|uniref:DUF6443 domain-containing protein n=1 Tax=Flavobacterium sp. TaxID=239 RepID=UPI00286DE1BF|nr:DUF6443 domain-containing protein [Flavobacterium sp.]
MKKILFIISMIPVLVLAQSANQNYVKSTTYKGAGATLPVSQITYFDGLGRPIQQIANAQSNTGKDIVTHIEYDAFGRQTKEFLPYANLAPSLNYNTGAGTAVSSFYNTAAYENTTNPYSEKLLENSPLNRVLEQAAPGNMWSLTNAVKHTIRMDYQTNTATEVKYFKATAIWNITKGLYDISITNLSDYDVNQLYKTITKDENWTSGSNNTSEEFKNKEGKVVLKRTYNNNEKHDTYYVYDQYDNLTYVLPPLANGTTDANTLDGLCYQYKYDYRNRLVEKKLPGKQWDYIVYDKLDRPVITGPAFSPWGYGTVGVMVTEYDVFNRVTQTGWKPTPVNETLRASWQTNTNNGSNPFVLTTIDILTKNYYDNYTYPNAPTLPTTLPNSTYPIAQKVKGFATGSWVRTLTTATETNGELSYTFYDDKYRPVRTHSTNHLGGFTQVDSQLDFVGKTVSTVTMHKRLDTDEPVIITDRFTYSAQDRLLLHKQQVNETPEELIVSNTYDELGQLVSKKVGGTDTTGATGLQKVDYNYNIRGWLKSINDTANLTQSGAPQDLFSFQLNYNDPTTATALFNGNIAETFWKTKSDNVLRKYSYSYDNLNRLNSAIYQKGVIQSPNSYGESMTYDKNGNIVTLSRNGEYDDPYSPLIIDQLNYSYSPDKPNQLTKVFDNTNNPNGFRDDTSGITDPEDDYTYDDNGNLITDTNKGITTITYNHLNLPVKIVFGNSEDSKIEYLYNAVGQKLSKIVTQIVCSGWRENTTCNPVPTKTEYLSGFQYRNEALEFFPHAEGYVKAFQEDQMYFFYVYNYTDHLGNVRLSYGLEPGTTTLKVLEESNYYPFGMKHNNYNVSYKQYLMSNLGIITLASNCNGCYKEYKYKYNGKELQDELGLNWYDFEGRQFMQDIGRTTTLDPLAEKFYDLSPQSFLNNNPLSFIDPTGMEVIEHKDGTTYTGADAQNMFKSLVSQIDGGEGDEEKDKKKGTENQKSKSEQLVSGIVNGLDDLLKAIAPIRIAEEGDPETLSEWWEGITNIPSNVSSVFEYGNLEDKTRLVTSSLGLLKGKKPSVSGIVKAGMKGGGKLLYFGRLAVNKDIFHKSLKPKILKSAGSFSSKVGNNPDISVVGGNINLTGTGPFKGKTFKTDLKASDYLTH